MKVVIVTTDNREHDRAYEETVPRFCPGHWSLLEGFMQLPRIEFHVLSCTQKRMQSPQKLADNMWFHSLHAPKIGWLRTFYQGCVRAVRRKVWELQPDIVHGHGTERECAISAALSGFPNLITIHGNMLAQAKQTGARIGSYTWLQSRVETFALGKTMGTLCNSTYTENLARGRTPRTWLVPHALRTPFFETPLQNTPRPCILLNAGVISPRKQQLELLNVAEALHKRGLKFQFHFIGILSSGHCPYAEEFLRRIKPMEAAGYARFLGLQPESNLVNCYDAASGVIHFPREEAFGNVVIEALSRNLKFFGTRLGGVLDIAKAAPGAELFDRDDWEGLTERIGDWIKRGHPRPADAVDFIRAGYHPVEIAKRHLEIYSEVLNKRP